MTFALQRRHFPAALSMLWAGLAHSAAQAAEPIQVSASFSILADIVRAVGAERVKVISLVGPDEDAHVFEPKPMDAKTILQSRLVVLNGLGFEHWMQKLLKSSGYQGATLEASTGVKTRSMAAEGGRGPVETDPHAWQDPSNVIVYVQNIAAALIRLDPAGASAYQKNAASYSAELKALDEWARTQINSIAPAKRKVITSHDAFGYFAAHYQLSMLAPQGVSTDTEPSAREVAGLIRQIQRSKIRAVFMENMANPKLIAQIAADTGVTLGPALYVDALSARDAAGSSYLQLMRHNVTELVRAMQQN